MEGISKAKMERRIGLAYNTVKKYLCWIEAEGTNSNH